MRFTSWSSLAVGLLAAMTSAAPYNYESSVEDRQAGTGRMVFAHFMMGIIANRQSSADYDSDMKRAKAAGIDAFALNVGTDDYTEKQLDFAYESAAKNDMKVFISFDFNWFAPASSAAQVGGLIKKYASKPAQLKVDNKIFVSSFNGDGLDVAAMRSAAGTDLYFAPNFHPGQTPDAKAVEAGFNWIAWPNNGENRAPQPGKNITVKAGDEAYSKWLAGKDYLAPVSPWFFTHYGQEVSYSKNWVFPGDLLWYNRWNEILELGPRFIEIITWNDYGESHYIGNLASPHSDDGNSKWVNDMPHNGWLDMAIPYIAAYKAGQKSPASFIKEDKLIYWYRPTLKSLDCTATDTTVDGRPNGYETFEDSVFVVALLKEDGKVTATSGSNTKSFDAKAGASAWKVDMAVGKQSFKLGRGGKEVISAISLRDVSDKCPCGIYNYNAFVGTVPAGPSDSLGPEGFTGFNKGLKVQCEAKPSLSSGSAPKPTSAVSAPPASSVAEVSSSVAVTSLPALGSSEQASSEPVSSAPVSGAPEPSAPATETPAATTTKAANPGAGGCTATVTASEQIHPTNCLGSGQVWGGGVGAPDCCDGAAPCCK